VNTVLIERVLETGQTLQIVQGDITAERVEAIVNAANAGLQHGGGVARAIVEAGGQIIQQESDEWIRTRGPVSHPHPAWTSAGRLPAKTVIHTVGPVWGAGDEDTKLSAAIRGALCVADERQAASLALPAISTGIFGFPMDRAAALTLKTIQAYFLERKSTGIQLVKLVLFDQRAAEMFVKTWHAEWGR
jgi:O-acetyl-ADP-ribose deacetylase (regulator of RNase III)